MELHTVVKSNGLAIILDEQCLINNNGDYVGCKTGNIYSQKEHMHKEKYKGKIVHIDTFNMTGMIHLSEQIYRDIKAKFLGCKVTLEKAHLCGELTIYRCLENGEYYSENEVEVEQ